MVELAVALLFVMLILPGLESMHLQWLNERQNKIKVTESHHPR